MFYQRKHFKVNDEKHISHINASMKDGIWMTEISSDIPNEVYHVVFEDWNTFFL